MDVAIISECASCATQRAPILVFGWGNPSRGDDALGPLFVERIAALGLSSVSTLQDYQLQIEHALDLAGRQRILFVDAGATTPPPFTISRLALSDEPSAQIFSHALSPLGLLHTFTTFYDAPPPPAFLLEIRGENFALGAPLSAAAQRHLAAALSWAEKWLK